MAQPGGELSSGLLGPLRRRLGRLNVWLSVILAAAIVLLWLVPLASSLWIDEIVTAFIVRYGGSHPSLGVARQLASIYDVLPRSATALVGTSAVAYRLPSVLAMALALYLVGRLAARLIDARAPWCAVFACLSLRGINYQAANARPYALGICLAAASFLFLVRWLDSGRWRDALVFVLAAALLWRVHLATWPLLVALAAYALLRLARAETRVGWLRSAIVFGLLGLALFPVLVDALAMLHDAKAHVVAPLPSARNLINSLKLGLVAACAVVGWCVRGLRTSRSPGFQVPPLASVALAAGWWLSLPIGLFTISHLTGDSEFLERYLSFGLPGVALFGTAAIACLISPASWKRASLLMAAVAFLNPGQWQAPWPHHENQDWRGAAGQVNRLTAGSETPVICPSPFVEAKPPVWRPNYPQPGFLYAHLAVFPISGRLFLFPMESSPDAIRFALTLSEQTLSTSGRFVIYGGTWNVGFWRRWFAARPELAGYRERKVGQFGVVEVVVFER